MSQAACNVRLMDITIDCGTCSQQNTSTCDGCVVSFIADREPDDAVVFDIADLSTLERLESAGLVPGLKHTPVADAI